MRAYARKRAARPSLARLIANVNRHRFPNPAHPKLPMPETSAPPTDDDADRTARPAGGGNWRSSRDAGGMGASKPYLFKRRLPHVLMDRHSEKRIQNEPIYRSE